MPGPPSTAPTDPNLIHHARLRSLGTRIREARITAGLTYRELAEEMRARGHTWTEDTVNIVQTGRPRQQSGWSDRRVWAVELPALAEVLGVSTGWLLGDVAAGGQVPPVRPLADEVFDYRTAPLPRLARQLRVAAGRLDRTPDPDLDRVGPDMREAADLLIPAALHLEEEGVPVLDDEDVDPARPGKPSEVDRFQVFYGRPGQRAAVDRVAAEAGCSRVAALRRIIAAGLTAFDQEGAGR